MAEKVERELESEALRLRTQINSIADQLCSAVKGDFSFTVELHTVEETVQKLTMLLNFVIDTARRALSDVKDKNTKLIDMDKAKSDFMANISHELRTPLTLILGPLQALLSHNSPTSPDQLENLQRMHRNASRLYMLVNDLLDFSKVEAGKFVAHDELLDVNELLSQVVDDAQGLAVERNLTLTYQGCDSLDLMLFDQKMLEKILLNLLSNALKFTPSGGNVKVHLTSQENAITFTVEDDGVGIPASQISKLFERFHQIDSSSTRVHEGTGIGLALISQFANLMQGDIKVESEEGKGTKFIVTLPIRRITKEEQGHHQYPSLGQQAQPLKVSLSQFMMHSKDTPCPMEKDGVAGERPLIIVADDNPDMRSYIVSLLEGTYEIIAVENGKLALEAVHKQHPQVILSDVMMPEMDGYALTKALKSDPNTQNIPIILITAKAGKEAIVSGLEIGADDYLPKPFSEAELKARTASALRLHQNFTKIKELVTKLSKSTQVLEESNQNLKKEIEERKKLEAKNTILNEELITAARRAGMADIATGILHNVGNVLTSVNTSATLISRRVDQSKISNLTQIGELLGQHEADIGTFLEKDPDGQRIPRYINTLAHAWEEDKKDILKELTALNHNIQHINEIIAKQNSFSGALGIFEETSMEALMEDSLIINKIAYERAQIDIVREFQPLKSVVIDRVKILQIIINLIKNGIESIIENNAEKKNLILRIQEKDNDNFMIQISDNGMGILPENLNKMFSYGFTTKKKGHGFGLHASAIAINEMGGRFSVDSQGAGKGATFTLTLPYQPPKGKDKEHGELKTEANLAG